MKCSECNHANQYALRRVGNGHSAGVRRTDVVYACNHPCVKHTVQSLGFSGANSPRNCPLRLMKKAEEAAHE